MRTNLFKKICLWTCLARIFIDQKQVFWHAKENFGPQFALTIVDIYCRGISLLVIRHVNSVSILPILAVRKSWRLQKKQYMPQLERDSIFFAWLSQILNLNGSTKQWHSNRFHFYGSSSPHDICHLVSSPAVIGTIILHSILGICTFPRSEFICSVQSCPYNVWCTSP